MKAVVLHEYGGPDKLKYEDFPDPVAGPDQVLIHVVSTSVNPVDYKQRSGAVKDRMPLNFPAILGRDVAGIVHAIGANVQGFSPGDHVFALAQASYAQLCVVPADSLAKLPDGIELAHAGAYPLVMMTGEQLVRLAAQVQPGQTVLVAGAIGSVGRCAVHTAKKLGAKVIAGVRKTQLDQAASLHADQVVALDDKTAMEKVGFLDAIADTVGGKVGEMLLGKVKPGGIYGTVVTPPENASVHPTVTVNRIMAKPDPETMIRMTRELTAGEFTIPVDRMLPLDDAANAQTAAEKGGLGKIVLLA